MATSDKQAKFIRDHAVEAAEKFEQKARNAKRLDTYLKVWPEDMIAICEIIRLIGSFVTGPNEPTQVKDIL